MAELLPCPFCGCRAELYRTSGDHQITTGEWILEDVWNCGCKKCGVGFSELNNRDLAVVKWNTRTPKERGGEK